MLHNQAMLRRPPAHRFVERKIRGSSDGSGLLTTLRVLVRTAFCLWCSLLPADATILWSDLGSTLVHDTGAGSSFLTGSAMDILGGAVKADDASSNVLYFKFRVDPLSDVSTE